MDTKIKDAFWKDPAVEQLVEAGDRDAILSLLWLLTAEVNHAGWVEVTPRRFLFQTSCSFEALQRACQALGKGIVSHPKGFWIRNFIRHQIGSGEALAANNMAAPVIKSFQTTPPEIVAEVLTQYPELKVRIKPQKLSETRSPSQALAEGCHSTREEKKREEKSRTEGNGSAEGKGPISLADALTFAKRWCENSPSMIAFDAVQVELWFADRERKQWQATSGQVIGSRAQAEKDLTFWLLKAKTGQTPSRPRRAEGENSTFEKKGVAGGGAHPLAVPPCVAWKAFYRGLVEVAGAADSDWVAWLEGANWDDVTSDDRQVIVDAWKKQGGGGAS
jgi:hypothetical protein